MANKTKRLELNQERFYIKFKTVGKDASKLEERVNFIFYSPDFAFDEATKTGEIKIWFSERFLVDGCFSFLECLKSIEFSEGICGSDNILQECKNLESVIFPDSFKTIPNFCCESCTSLKKVKFGKSVDIGTSAFEGCNSLKEISLPETLDEVGPFAFSESGLSKVKIPASLKCIRENAFKSCKALTIESFNGHIDFNVKNILKGEEWGFSKEVRGVPIFNIKDGLLLKYNGEEEEVIIPEGVTAIDAECFKDCRSITSVKIPNSVKYIGPYAFSMTSLEDIKIPDSVQVIGTGAFSYTRLEKIKLPENLIKIGISCFSNAGELDKDNVKLPKYLSEKEKTYLFESEQDFYSNVADEDENEDEKVETIESIEPQKKVIEENKKQKGYKGKITIKDIEYGNLEEELESRNCIFYANEQLEAVSEVIYNDGPKYYSKIFTEKVNKVFEKNINELNEIMQKELEKYVEIYIERLGIKKKKK